MYPIVKKKKAFTLIEMIISIAIMSVMAAIFGVVLSNGMQSWFFLKDQDIMLSETQGVLRRMTREIRTTRSASAADISFFTATRYQFVDTNGAAINYQQSGSNLQRNGVNLLSNLASGGLQLRYFDANGATATLAQNIRSIQIYLATQTGNNQARLQDSAAIRNR